MRVAIASDIELGSHRAHAINVVKTAGGFARLGHETRVLLRGRVGADPAEAARAYGEPRLAFELAPKLPPAHAEVHSSARQREFAAWSVLRAREWGADVLYARHFETALVGVAAGLATVLETHAYVGDANPALARALTATRVQGLGIATISPILREHYIERGGEPGRIAVVPDGVDVEMFSPPPRTDDAPFEGGEFRAHAVYAGHLYDYKGIPTIIGAAQMAPDIAFELVGGTPEDAARTRERGAELRNVRVHGMQPYADVPRWLWSADVLLLPPSAREASAAWTSPVKLGEYLASLRPIVASRIAGLTTWVDEPAVRWFQPDSARDLAGAVDRALSESAPEQRARREAARRYAQRFSYRNRAQQLLDAALASARAALSGTLP